MIGTVKINLTNQRFDLSVFGRFKRRVMQSTALQLIVVPYMRKFMILSVFVHSAIEVSNTGTMYNTARLPGIFNFIGEPIFNRIVLQGTFTSIV